MKRSHRSIRQKEPTIKCLVGSWEVIRLKEFVESSLTGLERLLIDWLDRGFCRSGEPYLNFLQIVAPHYRLTVRHNFLTQEYGRCFKTSLFISPRFTFQE